MKNKTNYQKYIAVLCLLAFVATFTACVKTDFDEPPVGGEDPDITANATIADLRALHTIGGLEEITEDWIVDAIVVADDQSGNFYQTLVIQDETGGIDLKIDASDLYNDYPAGRKIYINCKGLMLGDYNGLTQLGGGTSLFNGQEELDGIQQALISSYITKGPSQQEVTPTVVSINDLAAFPTNPYLSQLVKLENVEFSSSDAGLPYATYDAATDYRASENRTVQDCNGNNLVLRSSGYSTFVSELTPTGNGSLTVIFSIFGDTPQIYIRDLDDVNMTENRCDGSGGGGGGTGGEQPGELTAIADVRAAFASGNTSGPSGKKIRGVVISDRSNSNIDERNLVVQNGAGILVRFSNPHTFSLGDEIEVNVSGMELSEYNGLLQINNLGLNNATKVANGTLPTPQVLTVSDLTANFEAHESTLIRIENATISGGSTYSDFLDIADGTGTIDLYTDFDATFVNESVPSGAVTLTAIASQGGSGEYKQLIIRNLGDVVGGGSTGGNFDIVMSEDFSSATEFEDINLSNWTNWNEAGQLKWEARIYSDNPFASMSAFGSEDSENVAWLVTSSFALSSTSTLTFESSTGFYVHDAVEVLISTDYDGSNVGAATWQTVNCNLASTPPAGENYSDWESSGDVDLSSFGTSGNAHIAFKYSGNPNNETTSFRLDNIIVKEEN
ncbi:MAG: DUF5689 domain-containing protein [Chitinophagales bacterium]